MILKDIIQKLNLSVYAGKEHLEKNISGGYVSDLLSDVMGFSSENQIWITLQTHKNTVAIASLKDLAAIIMVKGLKPDEETIKHAEEENIPILGTHKETFVVAGELYNLLNS